MADQPPSTRQARIKLERLSIDHLESFHDIWSKHEVARWTSRFEPMETVEESRTLLLTLTTPTSDTISNYAVLLSHPNTEGAALGSRMIGYVGVHRAWSVELGYIFHPDSWGRGYATEAVNLFLELYWAEKPKIEAVRALVDPPNVASIGVLKKAGFVELGTGSFRVPTTLRVRDVSVFEIKRPNTESPT